MKEVHWANVLVWSRALFIIPITLFVLLGHTTEALVLYALAALTDLFDGMLARIQGTQSEYGAQLDGNVDALFVVASAAWLFIIAPDLYNAYWIEFLIAFTIFGVYATMSWYTYADFVKPHLWSSKVSTALLFGLLPVVLIWGIIPWYIHTTWIVFALSRLEVIYYVAAKRTEINNIPSAFSRSSSTHLKRTSTQKKK